MSELTPIPDTIHQQPTPDELAEDRRLHPQTRQHLKSALRVVAEGHDAQAKLQRAYGEALGAPPHLKELNHDESDEASRLVIQSLELHLKIGGWLQICFSAIGSAIAAMRVEGLRTKLNAVSISSLDHSMARVREDIRNLQMLERAKPDVHNPDSKRFQIQMQSRTMVQEIGQMIHTVEQVKEQLAREMHHLERTAETAYDCALREIEEVKAEALRLAEIKAAAAASAAATEAKRTAEANAAEEEQRLKAEEEVRAAAARAVEEAKAAEMKRIVESSVTEATSAALAAVVETRKDAAIVDPELVAAALENLRKEIKSRLAKARLGDSERAFVDALVHEPRLVAACVRGTARSAAKKLGLVAVSRRDLRKEFELPKDDKKSQSVYSLKLSDSTT